MVASKSCEVQNDDATCQSVACVGEEHLVPNGFVIGEAR